MRHRRGLWVKERDGRGGWQEGRSAGGGGGGGRVGRYGGERIDVLGPQLRRRKTGAREGGVVGICVGEGRGERRSDGLLVAGESVSLQEDLVLPGQGRARVTVERGLEVVGQDQPTAASPDQECGGGGQHAGQHSTDWPGSSPTLTS